MIQAIQNSGMGQLLADLVSAIQSRDPFETGRVAGQVVGSTPVMHTGPALADLIKQSMRVSPGAMVTRAAGALSNPQNPVRQFAAGAYAGVRGRQAPAPQPQAQPQAPTQPQPQGTPGPGGATVIGNLTTPSKAKIVSRDGRVVSLAEDGTVLENGQPVTVQFGTTSTVAKAVGSTKATRAATKNAYTPEQNMKRLFELDAFVTANPRANENQRMAKRAQLARKHNLADRVPPPELASWVKGGVPEMIKVRNSGDSGDDIFFRQSQRQLLDSFLGQMNKMDAGKAKQLEGMTGRNIRQGGILGTKRVNPEQAALGLLDSNPMFAPLQQNPAMEGLLIKMIEEEQARRGAGQ